MSLFLRKVMNVNVLINVLIQIAIANSRRWHHKENCASGLQIKQATNPLTHGEGPHWDVETQVLYFIDVTDQLVNRYDPATGLVTHAKLEGGPVSIAIPLEGTGARKLVTTRGSDILELEWNYQNTTFPNTTSENITLITSVDISSGAGSRLNDGKADARGRLWIGSRGPDGAPGQVVPDQAAFYLLNPNSTEAIVEVQPVTLSNGLAWNADYTLLYYIDTPTNQVDVFDFDLERGFISNRRKVFNFQEHNITGIPDGMTVDSKGNLWIACPFGGQVINVDPRSGTLIRSVKLPADIVTSVAFGGRCLDTLYVTSSRDGLTEEDLADQPLAGSVFAVSCLGITGLRAHNVLRDN